MSKTQVSSKHSSQTFVPPAYPLPHVYRQVEEMMSAVQQVVSRVWPLKDYVAINPYAGIADRQFSDARDYLRVFSDCELLMPLAYYRAQYAQGQFTIDDVRTAIFESDVDDLASADLLQSVVAQLTATETDSSSDSATVNRPLKTMTAFADQMADRGWCEIVLNEISKFCSAHYDQSQSTWQSPWKELPVYQAWRSAALHDRNVEVLGLSGFRGFVAQLPHTPAAAIVELLHRSAVPRALWESYLLCQVFSMPGWCAWAKYQDHQATEAGNLSEHLMGLIAARLAYDVALAESESLSINWHSLSSGSATRFRTVADPQDDSQIRMLLLRASEIHFRNGLLNSLNDKVPVGSVRSLAQMVFCIDVRSERIRRQLESQSTAIETFGFAGFFGMPIESVRLGHQHGDSHVPALIQPSLRMSEGFKSGDAEAEAAWLLGKQRKDRWAELWNGFQKSALGCFSFVETIGLTYAAKLFAGLGSSGAGPSAVAKQTGDAELLGPTMRGLNLQGWTTTRQTDLAETMLRNLGLTDRFARLVVFCGHRSQTNNNPLAAGLDCGACGGHSGEPNARFAALLLNQPFIRKLLAERGITIPADTHFLGGLHNTTTDSIKFFDLESIPASHVADVQQLLDATQAATALNRHERMPMVGSLDPADLVRRALDWSEVRPEWGLAGNAALIVGPRWMTQDMNLNGRVFLHSYDHNQDTDGNVLETIMTAPMVVAHWINMQYYASSVDNRHFGSGDKTIHNVVGGFGILSGNAGDLQTGLPMQSLHDGKQFQHAPLRLQVVIAAPLAAIEAVIEKHSSIQELLDNQWLALIAVDRGQSFQYRPASQWSRLVTSGHDDSLISEAVVH